MNFGHPLRALHASPSLREGEEYGVVCFSPGSRGRGNDGGGFSCLVQLVRLTDETPRTASRRVNNLANCSNPVV